MDQDRLADSRQDVHYSNKSKLKLVAIHLGASNSDRAKDRELELAKTICEKVMKSLSETREPSKEGKQMDDSGTNSDPLCEHYPTTAEEAVVHLVELMENESSLNCGFGSNLNMDGKVECDASLMSGSNSCWVGVGAVSSCKNPIRLAQSLMRHSKIARHLGLVQPNLLVGKGARRWMLDHCRHLQTPDSFLITSNSLSRYQVYKSRYDKAKRETPLIPANASLSCREEVEKPVFDENLDTVGAIAIDCDNNIACATSSGGVVLKNTGRLGQACVPGAGCWANKSTATTTTGVGEYLTATLFARAYHEKLALNRLLHDLGQTAEGEESTDFMINKAIDGCFDELLDSPALSHVPARERLVGMLTVSSVDNNHGNQPHQRHHECNAASVNEQDLYLSYGHTTRSLCIGYMLGTAQGARSFISRMRDDQGVEAAGAAVEEEEKGVKASGAPTTRVLIRTLKLAQEH